MPLVLLCGFPSSGKSTQCQMLQDEICSMFPSKKIHIVCDHPEGTVRNNVYSDSHNERQARGDLKSSVQRLLDKDTVVILDSMNYIKGFRYELFCVAKSCRTTHCVLYCVTDSETSKTWNMNRLVEEQYKDSLMDELIMRFECPSPNNRWDKPLFTILKDEELNYKDVCSALFEQKALLPNQSTQSQPLSSTNFLYELDKTTQDIISSIIAAQKTAVPGDVIRLSEEFLITRIFTLAELQRHRRQFITYTKMHPIEDISKVSSMFLQYLHKSLNN